MAKPFDYKLMLARLNKIKIRTDKKHNVHIKVPFGSGEATYVGGIASLTIDNDEMIELRLYVRRVS